NSNGPEPGENPGRPVLERLNLSSPTPQDKRRDRTAPVNARDNRPSRPFAESNRSGTLSDSPPGIQWRKKALE
ncbi:MAG: hypothetical protein MI747_08150, partial [Desulfobacterales bacterium]|nr:hypothetical protein [Desulfobacterales bacterium]